MSTTADTAAATDAAVHTAVRFSRPASDAAPASDVAVHTTVHFGRTAADSAPATDLPYRLILTVVGPFSGGIVYGGSASPVRMNSVSPTSGGIAYGGSAVPQVQYIAGTPLVRWRFDDPVDASAYLFEVNPNAGGSARATQLLTVTATTAADGQPLIFAGDNDLLSSQFSGVLRSQAQYDAFMTWFAKNRPVQLTDDLGRRSIVNLVKLDFKRAGQAHGRFRQSYTVDYQILAQLDV